MAARTGRYGGRSHEQRVRKRILALSQCVVAEGGARANRIEATGEITNVAEQRALEKAGFTREGVLRGSTFRHGQWHEQVLYSVLRDEIKLDEAATVPDGDRHGRPTKEIDSCTGSSVTGRGHGRLDNITDRYAPVRLASRDVSRPLVIGNPISPAAV